MIATEINICSPKVLIYNRTTWKFRFCVLCLSCIHVYSSSRTKFLRFMLKGEECKNLTTTVIKTLPTACDNKFRKRIPPKPPAKPKKRQPELPSIKPVVIKPKPLPKPKIYPSQPSRTEKQQRNTQHKMEARKGSFSRVIMIDFESIKSVRIKHCIILEFNCGLMQSIVLLSFCK